MLALLSLLLKLELFCQINYALMHNAFLYIEEILDNNDLIDIIDVLEEGQFPTTDWYRLGLRLRIEDKDLKIIEHNYPKNVIRCLEDCLLKWLKTGKATYTGLAEALKKMGENAAADHISTGES